MNVAIRSVQEATGLPPASATTSVWGIADSQSAAAATEAYAEDPKAKDMMARVAHKVHEGKPIVMTRPLNVVTTPSHRYTSGNRWADKTVALEHDVLGHNLLRLPFNFAPPEVQGDQYQLGPKALGRYLQLRETAALAALHREHFGPKCTAWQPGRGVPIEWFNYHQQRHILMHRVTTIPTMTELARRTAYREVVVPGKCWFCGQPDTVRHAWNCLPTRHVVNYILEGWYTWLDQHWYADRVVDRAVVEETHGASYIVVWCMATTTTAFQTEGLSVATQDSVGVQFLQQVVDASMRLHQYRYEHREVAFREQNPHLQHHTLKSWLHGLWEEKNRGTKGGEDKADDDDDMDGEGAEDCSDSEEEDWSTDDDSQDWEEWLKADPGEGHPSEQDEDEDWDLQDDIRVAD